MQNTTRYIIYGALGILLTLSIFRFGYEVYKILISGFADFPIFWDQAVMFFKTGQLYPHELTEYATPSAYIYVWPPLYIILFVFPFIKIGTMETVSFIQWGLQILLYLTSFVLVLNVFKLRSIMIFAIIVFVLWLNNGPFFETLFGLQLEVPILFLLILCLFLYVKKMDSSMGITLAIATMLKLYPVVMLAFFISKRKWSVVKWFFVAMVFIFGFSVIVVGFKENYLYFSTILPVKMSQTVDLSRENISMTKYIQHIFINPLLSMKIGRAVSLLMLAISCLVVYSNKSTEGKNDLSKLEYSLFIPVMLLLLHNSWTNYQLLLLLPIIAILHLYFYLDKLSVKLLIITAFAYVFTLVPDYPPYQITLYFVPKSLYGQLLNCRFLSTVFIWLTLLFFLVNKGTQTRIIKEGSS